MNYQIQFHIRMKKLISALLLCSSFSFSQIIERPTPQKLYNNFSKEFPQFLTNQQTAQLEEKLEAFSNETSNQICIVVVDDLNGLDPADYATKIINEWGIGQKEKNNGIVILVKPTGGKGERELFIAIGYGLEGAIPDITTKHIRENEMYPYLKKGDYFTALDKATDVLIKLAKGEINEKDYRRQNRSQGLSAGLIILIIFIILIIISIKGGGGGRTFSNAGSALFWGSMLGGGGRGFGGGSSSGGFGGFGGGSSGGGGSGGSW
jgi:uncharacterized protein